MISHATSPLRAAVPRPARAWEGEPSRPAAAAAPASVRLPLGILKRPPLWTMVGLGLLALGLLPYVMGVQAPVLGGLQQSKIFNYGSGIALLSYIAVQWKLFLHRETGKNPATTARWYKAHKILGALAPALFVLHAGSFGHAMMAALSSVFFISVCSGLFNRDLLTVRSTRFWQVWTIVHVGTAFAMYALIGLHVWIALTFTG